MLRRQKDEYEQNNTEYQLPPKQETFAGSISDKEKTVIGERISIDGTIHAKEDLIIQGSLKGSMELDKHHVTIGNKGKVDADIQAEGITVSGTLHGNVTIHGKIEITKEANFTGQIKAKRVAIEDGAFINASIEMKREEDKKPKSAAKPPIDAVVIAQEETKTGLDKKLPAGN